MTTALLLLILVAALAYWNGANDVSKGIATLAGSGVANLKTAVIWGTLCTVAGALTAAVLAGKLVKAFSGSGLITDMPVGHGFLLAVAIGSMVWVAIATLTRLPVSTTHSITGALVGAGVAVGGWNGLNWDRLLDKFLIPLAVSPLLALALMYFLFPLFSFGFARLQNYCLCLEKTGWSLSGQSAAAMTQEATEMVAGKSTDCECEPAVTHRLNILDALHWLSSGAVSFARGLNDAPKILGVGLAASLTLNLDSGTALFIVALAMGLGSAFAGFKVTETLATKVTPMSPVQGFSANLVTAFLVIIASRMGVPVSTTHVSSSAIIGMGLKRDAKSVNWNTVRDMLLAWLVTLPIAAIIAATVVSYFPGN